MSKVCGGSVIAAREIAANTTLPNGNERHIFRFSAVATKNQLDLGSGQILGDNVGRISSQATSWLTDGHKRKTGVAEEGKRQVATSPDSVDAVLGGDLQHLEVACIELASWLPSR